MKKVLVTGAAGFIAYHVIENLINSKFEVLGVDINDPSNPIEGCNYLRKNVIELTQADIQGIDYIIHLACNTNIRYSIENPVSTTNNNLGITIKLLSLATKAKIKKFVFPSTASMYGDNSIPWNEDMISDPGEPYSWQKISIEFALKTWASRYKLPTTILRLFQVFGENQRKDTAIAAFMNQKKNNKPITLIRSSEKSKYNTGRRDWIYVKDIAEAFKLTLLSGKTGNGEIINIASGKLISVEDIAKTVGGEITFLPSRDYEVDDHLAEVSKAKKILNWEYKTDVIPWLKSYLKENL
jgi:nucleoside-diphosphate-sugar epimerase